MNDFFNSKLYNNSITDWAISIAILVGSILIGKIVYLIFNKTIKGITSKSKSKIDDIILEMIKAPFVLALSIAGFWIGIERLALPAEINIWINKIYQILVTINVTWFLSRFTDAIIREYVIPFSEKSESTVDNQIVPVVRKVVRIIIWSVGIILALNNAGYDVGALIAGLGIGGLALAMAAKETVSNMFGGMMIFTVKSFKVGDRIKINGFDGTISEISFQVTRMITLDGRKVTIPNSLFIGNIIENISAEPSRKVSLNLGMVYETTPEQMQKAMNILKEISTNKNLDEGTTIGFISFGDFNLGINFVYFIKKESDIIDTQTEINLEILKQFNSNGLSFAFPTHTVYSKPIL
ncbi:MAG: mechanosensitive ion channel family protein [Flavobacteriales bacterium]|nr:mechanosensitive ion channel family protein [Flavobacteriales bacterium]